MTCVVVLFDVLKCDRFRDAGLLVQVTQVPPQIDVVHDPASIALEVTNIDRVKSYQGGEQPPVCLRDVGPT